ncbi:MAG: 4a-hydroxytetrahydrobiopterin dehydratase [Pirellulaceae bacterium]|nr:MAG: 4a-hydroxytetrahydrobiopterin dehydratase [Pirellulaceae bacterium]
MDVQSATELTTKKCKPCEGGVEPCTLDEAREQLRQLEGWELSEDGKWIAKTWRVKNFAEAMRLLNAVAEVAEEDGHHPDLHLTGFRNVRIELTTHAIKGLSENDFILAAKIDQVAKTVLG